MFDIKEVRAQFPMLNGIKMDGHDLVYLDSGATALKPQRVIDKVVEYYSNYSTNIHRGDYALSHKTDSEYENVREIVKTLINSKESKEIAFTYGATHGLNIVAEGLKHQLKKGDVVLMSEFEHAANVLPWFRLKEEIGIEIEYVPLDENHYLQVEGFKKALHDKVKIVALAHVSNVIGQPIDMKEITKLAHENGSIVVVDGAQSVPHMKVDVQDLDIDFMVFSGHKLGGPTGIGVLYGKYDLLNALPAYILGGGMNNEIHCDFNYQLKEAPYKFEAGTPAIEATLGMGAAIQFLLDLGVENTHDHVAKIRAHAIKRMQEEVDNIVIYNPNVATGPISFNVKGYEGPASQDIGSALATRGIAVRTGEHCAKLLTEVLHVKGSVRASLYYYNSIEDMDRFVDALIEITKGDALDWLL
ncbi:aminotransferase class V-fold PLP-dependent enzyme [Mycoplasma sp. P36-A1]|uniref:aminotransferase class V-fold PLP-dependent enzyme n=1 Tax=Mycoplasma sp. P36-A1 TaxID=3252900 RepID=UPI003C2AD36D